MPAAVPEIFALVELKGGQWRKTRGSKTGFGLLDPLLLEPLDGRGGHRRRHDDLMATAAYRRQQMLRVMRHENEQGTRRRFFQVLQQRVCRGWLHGLSRMDHDDLVSIPVAGYIDKIGKIAYLLYLDVTARFSFGFRAAGISSSFIHSAVHFQCPHRPGRPPLPSPDSAVGGFLDMSSGSTRRKSGWLPCSNQ